MYLNCILQKLNAHLNIADERFAGSRYFELAYPTTREIGGTTQVFPTIVRDGKAEAYIGIDDNYPLTVYHKLNAKPYRRLDVSDKVYVAECQMTMVVFAKKTNLNYEQLESLFASIFPEGLTQSELTGMTGVDRVVFTLQSSDLNPANVFNREYRGVDYRLTDENILFSVNYRCDITFQKDCLDLCDPADVPTDLCGFIDASTAAQIKRCLDNDSVKLSALEALICNGDSTDIQIYLDNVLQSTTTVACGGTETINVEWQ